MATTPNFAATPNVSAALINTANTDTTGATGTRGTIYTAGANGSRIDKIHVHGIVAEGTEQAADCVRLWLNNGTTTYFLTEVAIPSGGAVVSATVTNADVEIPLGITIPTGWTLTASTHVGGSTASYHVMAFGGDL